MGAFLTGLLGLVLISVVAGFTLHATDRPSSEVFSTSNVRLDPCDTSDPGKQEECASQETGVGGR